MYILVREYNIYAMHTQPKLIISDVSQDPWIELALLKICQPLKDIISPGESYKW